MNQPNRIVRGANVDSHKVALSKQLRQHMTPAEQRLWQVLRNHQLDDLHFRRQQVIDGFIVDFYCHATALVVEVDGNIHLQQVDYDYARDQVLSQRGLLILRLSNEAVLHNLSDCLTQIRTLCHARNASNR